MGILTSPTMLISVFQTLDHLHISNSDIQHPRGIIKATSTSIVFLDFGTLSPHLTFTSQFPPSSPNYGCSSGISFFQSLIPTILVHTITCVHAKNVPNFLSICISIILCYRFLLFLFLFFLLCSPSSLVAVGFASRPSVQTLLTTLNLSLVTSTSIFGYSVLQSL